MLDIGPRLSFLLWGLLVFLALSGLLVMGMVGKFLDVLKERWTRPRVTLAMRLNANTSDEMAAMLQRMEQQGK